MVTHMDKEELLAEKVRAFMTRQKGRNIFDIWFLLSKGTVLNNELIQKKMDYYKKKYSLEELKQRLKSFPLANLKRDLGQFLPASHRQDIEKFPQMALERL
jgi:predicted nucleotidyltransferase component of viral defense system